MDFDGGFALGFASCSALGNVAASAEEAVPSETAGTTDLVLRPGTTEAGAGTPADRGETAERVEDGTGGGALTDDGAFIEGGILTDDGAGVGGLAGAALTDGGGFNAAATGALGTSKASACPHDGHDSVPRAA